MNSRNEELEYGRSIESTNERDNEIELETMKELARLGKNAEEARKTAVLQVMELRANCQRLTKRSTELENEKDEDKRNIERLEEELKGVCEKLETVKKEKIEAMTELAVVRLKLNIMTETKCEDVTEKLNEMVSANGKLSEEIEMERKRSESLEITLSKYSTKGVELIEKNSKLIEELEGKGESAEKLEESRKKIEELTKNEWKLKETIRMLETNCEDATHQVNSVVAASVKLSEEIKIERERCAQKQLKQTHTILIQNNEVILLKFHCN
ncbi:hypothetical protein PFISCL1PPCAC_6658 [Pristionchus fissidentatus]|uniref:Uncharacterized protein n=1 Tax=Pristionchus fissidentatus TaxID=1538716 RepID=A0AAV5V6V6_9BILA|nr:hypothetical protein PFISCL1PPCAC_6658 [Pristionchus fissidentatus]